MTQKIRLTESELYNMIAEQVNEALQDEGMMDFFRGAGKKQAMISLMVLKQLGTRVNKQPKTQLQALKIMLIQ